MKLSAFVGHSFLEKDKVVVAGILEGLNEISKLIKEFTWDHALEPQAKNVQEKVLEKISDKNLFIGICTGKELVSDNKNFKNINYSSYKKIHKDKLELKTSDWIIQEIGLAVGRGMKLILLIEEGVRHPGGLQGGIEYISFTRNDPGQCIMKLTQMINSLKDSRDNEFSFIQNNKEEKSITCIKEEKGSRYDTEPNVKWGVDEYKNGLIQCLFDKNLKKADYILDSYRGIEKDEEKQAELEVLKLNLSQLLELDNVTEKLIVLSKKFRHNIKIGVALGEHYRNIGLIDQSLNIFRQLSDRAVEEDRAEEEDRVNMSLKVGECLVELEKYDEAINYVSNFKKNNNLSDENNKKITYWTISYYEAQEKWLEFACLAECYLLQLPQDDNLRFKLAYRYENIGYQALSIKHYKVLCSKRSNSTDWNNLGVAYSNLSLSGLAVDAYKKSINHKGTLAASNLGHKYINEGFLEEAGVVLNKAMEEDDCDPKVIAGLSSIVEYKENEKKKIEEELAAHEDLKSFLIRSGEHMIMKKIPDGDYNISGDRHSYILKIKGCLLSGTFSYKEKIEKNYFFALASDNREFCEYTVLIEGTVVGHSLFFDKTKKNDKNNNNYGLSQLGLSSAEKCIGIFSESLDLFETVIKGEKKVLKENISTNL